MEKVKVSISNLVAFNLFSEKREDGHKTVIDEFAAIIPFDENSRDHLYKQIQALSSQEKTTEFLTGLAGQLVESWKKEFGKEQIAHVYKLISLSTIDNFWMDHLTAMEDLRTGIGLRGYGQRDPLVEYKNESFQMFERLVNSVDDEIAHRAFKVNLSQVAPQMHVHTNVSTNTPESEVSSDTKKTTGRPPSRKASADSLASATQKLGRNDPCPCGSGKKWKKCHYPNIP